jgi:hypothetical protein
VTLRQPRTVLVALLALALVATALVAISLASISSSTGAEFIRHATPNERIRAEFIRQSRGDRIEAEFIRKSAPREFIR